MEFHILSDISSNIWTFNMHRKTDRKAVANFYIYKKLLQYIYLYPSLNILKVT